MGRRHACLLLLASSSPGDGLRSTDENWKLARAAESSLTRRRRAVLGDWQTRPRFLVPQQPHFQQHQTSVSNLKIEMTIVRLKSCFRRIICDFEQKLKTNRSSTHITIGTNRLESLVTVFHSCCALVKYSVTRDPALFVPIVI